ncbi:hypothetical protein GLI01_34090 [Gluconacetobacter liquefaciens]|uniref:DUF2628 domain-containing protein n=1 Tax=Gluconacetobacter liquefaciens TaxID=89584 RepID=A0A370FZK7_GLULI|nr:hypothetical protein [Gluconacetobacter liquefaciens]MBB2188094.1 hypothetical protein [Gluconacetobacter liquefaciens]RDI36206.1 hypothetical protein C7453_11287 [Gluconacetobacter liquefaciens]GBR04976.1 hypothetical protein AA0522_1950 [Gluconacetobacter liquefaciens NRIC 0522]GEB39374.1 hypothetical protein GLI01_34090 [Gluconacetobacter liquefaciens]
MTTYTTWFRADDRRPPVLVAERLSWRVLLLGWLGLVIQGSWIAGLLAGAGSLILLSAVQTAHLPLLPFWAGLHLLLGLCAADIRAWELRLNGLAAGPIVVARGHEAALLRLLERNPTLARTRGNMAEA